MITVWVPPERDQEDGGDDDGDDDNEIGGTRGITMMLFIVPLLAGKNIWSGFFEWLG